MGDQSLFRGDSLTVAGDALAVVDGSIQINGVGSYTSTVVPSASGPDFESHARVPRTITCQIQFGPKVNPEDITKILNKRIVVKDSKGPRRCVAPNCSFGSMGTVGTGPTDVTFNVLEPYQWL